MDAEMTAATRKLCDAFMATLPPWSGCSKCPMCGNDVGAKVARFVPEWAGRSDPITCMICAGRGMLLSGSKCGVCNETGQLPAKPAVPRHMMRTCECGHAWEEKTLADSGKDGE